MLKKHKYQEEHREFKLQFGHPSSLHTIVIKGNYSDYINLTFMSICKYFRIYILNVLGITT